MNATDLLDQTVLKRIMTCALTICHDKPTNGVSVVFGQTGSVRVFRVPMTSQTLDGSGTRFILDTVESLKSTLR